MLTAKAITKDYDVPVLRGIDLQLSPGEFVAIMGPSGSGKTTLLHILSGMARPSTGSVRFEDTELDRLSERELAALRLTRLGFVFQQSHLLASLNLLDNVVLPGFLADQHPRDEVVQRGGQLMDQLGVGELKERGVAEASGGQLQRVGICRALINEPKIIFGDEPTGALNSGTASQILDVLGELNAAGTTLVLVTHDAAVAARAQRVVLLVDGVVAADIDQGPWHESTNIERTSKIAQLLSSFGV